MDCVLIKLHIFLAISQSRQKGFQARGLHDENQRTDEVSNGRVSHAPAPQATPSHDHPSVENFEAVQASQPCLRMAFVADDSSKMIRSGTKHVQIRDSVPTSSWGAADVSISLIDFAESVSFPGPVISSNHELAVHNSYKEPEPSSKPVNLGWAPTVSQPSLTLPTSHVLTTLSLLQGAQPTMLTHTSINTLVPSNSDMPSPTLIKTQSFPTSQSPPLSSEDQAHNPSRPGVVDALRTMKEINALARGKEADSGDPPSDIMDHSSYAPTGPAQDLPKTSAETWIVATISALSQYHEHGSVRVADGPMPLPPGVSSVALPLSPLVSSAAKSPYQQEPMPPKTQTGKPASGSSISASQSREGYRHIALKPQPAIPIPIDPDHSEPMPSSEGPRRVEPASATRENSQLESLHEYLATKLSQDGSRGAMATQEQQSGSRTFSTPLPDKKTDDGVHRSTVLDVGSQVPVGSELDDAVKDVGASKGPVDAGDNSHVQTEQPPNRGSHDPAAQTTKAQAPSAKNANPPPHLSSAPIDPAPSKADSPPQSKKASPSAKEPVGNADSPFRPSGSATDTKAPGSKANSPSHSNAVAPNAKVAGSKADSQPQASASPPDNERPKSKDNAKWRLGNPAATAEPAVDAPPPFHRSPAGSPTQTGVQAAPSINRDRSPVASVVPVDDVDDSAARGNAVNDINPSGRKEIHAGTPDEGRASIISAASASALAVPAVPAAQLSGSGAVDAALPVSAAISAPAPAAPAVSVLAISPPVAPAAPAAPATSPVPAPAVVDATLSAPAALSSSASPPVVSTPEPPGAPASTLPGNIASAPSPEPASTPTDPPPISNEATETTPADPAVVTISAHSTNIDADKQLTTPNPKATISNGAGRPVGATASVTTILTTAGPRSRADAAAGSSDATDNNNDKTILQFLSPWTATAVTAGWQTRIIANSMTNSNSTSIASGLVSQTQTQAQSQSVTAANMNTNTGNSTTVAVSTTFPNSATVMLTGTVAGTEAGTASTTGQSNLASTSISLLYRHGHGQNKLWTLAMVVVVVWALI